MAEHSAELKDSHSEDVQDGSQQETRTLAERVSEIFMGDALPVYLMVTSITQAGTLALRVDLGLETAEAVRRVAEVNALSYPALHLGLVELDGPRHLHWEQLTTEIARLLLVKKVARLAVPQYAARGVRGRLAGLVLNSLRARPGADPLPVKGTGEIALRDVIDTEVLTSRVLLLQPMMTSGCDISGASTTAADDERLNECLEPLIQALRSCEASGKVSREMRPIVAQLFNLCKRDIRREQRNHLKRARQPKWPKVKTRAALPAEMVASSDSSSVDTEGEEEEEDSEQGQQDCPAPATATAETRPPIQEDDPPPPTAAYDAELPEPPAANPAAAIKPTAGPSNTDTHAKKTAPSADTDAKCYICRKRWSPPKNPTAAVRHYNRLCPPCAEVNWTKRHQLVNLKGYVAVVTGGRIKNGYETVLKLLRCGCQVVATTRFPNDAAHRYSAEADYSSWSDHLHIYPLELKDGQGIYKFIRYLTQNFTHIDILICNAAQTIRRPVAFYEHLFAHEQIPREQLPEVERHLLAISHTLTYSECFSSSMLATEISSPGLTLGASTSSQAAKRQHDGDEHDRTTSGEERPPKKVKVDREGLTEGDIEPITDQEGLPGRDTDMTTNQEGLTHADPDSLSDQEGLTQGDKDSTIHQVGLTDRDAHPANDQEGLTDTGTDPTTNWEGVTDRDRHPTTLNQEGLKDRHTDPTDNREGVTQGDGEPRMSGSLERTEQDNMFFPMGCLDSSGQQLDLRPTNSWRAVLEEVTLSELLEVMMVNSIAPYLLVKELRPLMVTSPHKHRFIVNVTAMEGTFNYARKTPHHPHTNMAKAALNMMTRTGALSYRRDHIYMTAVDTGWMSDQRPFEQAQYEKRKRGFTLPLDYMDGASRVLDPIFSGIVNNKEPYFAVLLKNYKPIPW